MLPLLTLGRSQKKNQANTDIYAKNANFIRRPRAHPGKHPRDHRNNPDIALLSRRRGAGAHPPGLLEKRDIPGLASSSSLPSLQKFFVLIGHIDVRVDDFDKNWDKRQSSAHIH